MVEEQEAEDAVQEVLLKLWHTRDSLDNYDALDFCGQIGYGMWSVFAKYSPFSIFQNDKGPEVRSVSLGAVLNF